MTQKDAEVRVAKPAAFPEGSGRNPRVAGDGASNLTAKRGDSCSETTQLMEEVVERGNMLVSLLDQQRRLQCVS